MARAGTGDRPPEDLNTCMGATFLKIFVNTSMAPAPDYVQALIREIEASVVSLRTDSLLRGHALYCEDERVLQGLLAQTQRLFQEPPRKERQPASPPVVRTPTASTGSSPSTTRPAARGACSETPQPPINRQASASGMGAATPSQKGKRVSSRRNRFEGPLNGTTGRPKRVLCKTPPPSRSNAAKATPGHVAPAPRPLETLTALHDFAG